MVMNVHTILLANVDAQQEYLALTVMNAKMDIMALDRIQLADVKVR